METLKAFPCVPRVPSGYLLIFLVFFVPLVANI